MAVAVKTPPGARFSNPLASPALISLLGVLYLIACLVIVFKLLPSLWWSAWDSAGLARFGFVGGSLLVVVALAVAVALLVLGSRLLGPNPPAGVRSGVFLAFAGFIVVLLLARWVSLWLEHWAYDTRWLNPSTGAMLAAAAGLALLAGWVWLFARPKTQKFVLLLEHAGWFHATAYKGNQGQKVRRGTIFGILLLVGAGIYTLISHGTLRRGSPDLQLNIPFTGKMIIDSPGDAEQFIMELPAAAKKEVQIRTPGVTNLQPKQIVSLKTYQDSVADVLKHSTLKGGEVEDLQKAASDDPVVYLKKFNELIYAKMQALLSVGFFPEDAVKRIREVDQRTDMADLSELIAAFEREAEKKEYVKIESKGDSDFADGQIVSRNEFDATVRRLESEKAKGRAVTLPSAIPTKPSRYWILEALGPAFQLPTAVLVVDRYAMQAVNEKTAESEYVKIGLKGDSNFKEGQIVSRAEFDAAVAKLEEEKKKGRDRELPQKTALVPASGSTTFDSVTLLPSVQFTVPLLLLVLSLWLAWRIVNMPTFADFLIATEAELNKVSWTTQKRLVQDTIVVLVTVALMAMFLFGMDWMWKEVLAWKPIGVLHIPKDASDTEKKIEQKRW